MADARSGVHVVLVDRDPLVRGALARLVRAAGSTVRAFSTCDAAFNYLASDGADLLLADADLDECSPATLVGLLRAARLDCRCIVMSAGGDLDGFASTPSEVGFVTKPISKSMMLAILTDGR